MSVMSEIQRCTIPSRRFWPGSEKGVLWALTLLIGILSIAPLMRLVWAAMAPKVCRTSRGSAIYWAHEKF